VVLQLILAAMLDTFAIETTSDSSTLTSRQLTLFSEAWAELDPEATQMIRHAELAQLVMSLPQPLGFNGEGTPEDALPIVQKMKVKVHKQKGGSAMLQFHDVLGALSHSLQKRGGASLTLPPKSSCRRVNSFVAGSFVRRGSKKSVEEMAKRLAAGRTTPEQGCTSSMAVLSQRFATTSLPSTTELL